MLNGNTLPLSAGFSGADSGKSLNTGGPKSFLSPQKPCFGECVQKTEDWPTGPIDPPASAIVHVTGLALS